MKSLNEKNRFISDEKIDLSRSPGNSLPYKCHIDVTYIFVYHLRRRNRLLWLLEVVDVEVLLEVEVSELVILREVEELEESRITLDVVLVLEVLLLHVGRDELRDV